jgi:hypothetical protein
MDTRFFTFCSCRSDRAGECFRGDDHKADFLHAFNEERRHAKSCFGVWLNYYDLLGTALPCQREWRVWAYNRAELRWNPLMRKRGEDN